MRPATRTGRAPAHAAVVLAAALLLAGCGRLQPPPRATSTGSGAGAGADGVVIAPGQPGERLGYAWDGPEHPTPNPVSCAVSAAQPPPTAHTVRFTWPPAPQTSITVHAGEELLVRMEERCTFSLTIEPGAKFGDPSVLAVVEEHPLARGVQGTAWTIFRAVHSGTTRVVAFGGCAIPSPMPAEPSGISLVCDDVGHAEEVSVTVG